MKASQSSYFDLQCLKRIAKLEHDRDRINEQIQALRVFLRTVNGPVRAKPSNKTAAPWPKPGSIPERLYAYMRKSDRPMTSQAMGEALGIPYGSASSGLDRLRRGGLVKSGDNSTWLLTMAGQKLPKGKAKS